MNVSRETFIVAFLYRNERRVESTWSFQLASASGKTKMPGDLLKALPKSSNSPVGSNSELLGSNTDHRPFKVFQRLVQRLDGHALLARLSVAAKCKSENVLQVVLRQSCELHVCRPHFLCREMQIGNVLQVIKGLSSELHAY